MQKIKKIGVLTSGGDAPGMNACVRAVVRTGIYYGLDVTGILSGYEGLIAGQFRAMESHSVSNIIQNGGTILKTARSKEFMTKEGRQKAYENLKKDNFDALITIGGNGTFAGACEFSNEYDFPVIGIPGTIDNDLYGTDFTIGFDTALNTVVSAIDKIRDTADSHNRLFFIEVMGRDAGFLALRSGIAGGAEDILVPETETHIEELIEILEKGFRKNKRSGIIVVAEGDSSGGAFEIARKVSEKYDHYETRVTILGHVQRGGSPSCFDRFLAGRLGYESVKALLNGQRGVMAGLISTKVEFTPLVKSVKHHKDINREFLEMARILAM